MKKLYWRPQRISVRVLFLLAAVALLGVISVETFRVRQRQPYYGEKLSAARLARKAFSVIKERRQELRVPIDPEADPARSGLIGVLLSPVTTNPGHLPAKQTTINPNFAALVVHYLRRAGVEEGELVAVGFSGSFPALNITVMAALETIKARPVIISSVGASQWGANIPKFMWPDMERLLFDKRIFSFRSVAASRGGIEDRGRGLSRGGREMLVKAIDRNDLVRIDVVGDTENIERRMAIYREHAQGTEFAAYINVGGGTSSVGTSVGKKMFRPGLNTSPPRGVHEIDSVMSRFALEDVPVIHLIYIDQLASRYGLPLQPVVMPAAGEGAIFQREAHNFWLAVSVLVVIVLLLFVFVRFDWGYRLLTTGRRDKGSSRPEQMA